jgi:F0F1-type ATP synthase assembly protein I
MIYAVKVIISAVLIVAASEIAKRVPAMGGIIASLPITSLLAIIWLYYDTRNVQQVQSLSYGILWAVIPSLVLFISLPIMLKNGWRFDVSIIASCALTFFSYLGFNWIYTRYIA